MTSWFEFSIISFILSIGTPESYLFRDPSDQTYSLSEQYDLLSQWYLNSFNGKRHWRTTEQVRPSCPKTAARFSTKSDTVRLNVTRSEAISVLYTVSYQCTTMSTSV